MSDLMLVHLNVVRPLTPVQPDAPNVTYFFRQFPQIAARGRSFDGMYWHNHGARMPDGRYLTLEEFTTLNTDTADQNPHVLTMAGWRDVAALQNFAWRMEPHRSGAKHLRDWVDRSEGATMVLWWAPRGQRVPLEAAWDKLMLLRAQGPGPEAFTLQHRYDPPADGGK